MKIIIVCCIALVPLFVIIYAVIAESIKERRIAKQNGVGVSDKPKHTYTVWSVLSGIFLTIPVYIYEICFKRTKRYK